MKSTAPLTAAGGLTKVRPLRAHSTVTDRARVFDIVAIFDLFSDNALKGADIQSRQHWVERCLPKAFPEARIVPFGDVHQARLVSESVVDIEAFGFNFLNNLLQLRQSTKTTSRPFVILFHNTSGANMLLKFILGLSSFLSAHGSAVELATDLRGIVCLENSQTDGHVAHGHSSPETLPTFKHVPLDSLSSRHLQQAEKESDYMKPVTVLLDEGSPHGQYIRESLDFCSQLSMIFSPLDNKSYPSTLASQLRVIGEISRVLPQPIEGPLRGMEGARFQRWLSPSEGLIRCEPSSTMKGSCDWLFKHEAYRSWLNSAHNEFLWIRGKPGSGKSALSKFLVEQIRENIAFQSRRSIVAAIFFDFRYVLTQEGGSAKGLLLRALLYQILEKDPSILSDFQKSLDLMNPFPERPEDVDDHHYERCLGNALIAASVNAQVFIVIDGLDECTPAVQNDLMACIEPIYKATYFQPRVRIVVTSRWISPMQRVNEKYPTKQIHLEKENTQAIATYCSARLYSRLMNPAILLGDRHPTVPDDARGPLQRLVTEITTRAKGIFLWVRLVVDILVTDFPVQEGLSHGMEEWRKVLQNMPTGLDSLYETLIDRVSPTKILAARHVISWCMYAVRPLTMDELTTAIRYSTERTDSVLYDEIHLQETRPPLERLCWGLLEFVPDPTSHTSLVQLVHSSAKEYLLGVGARHVMPTGLAHTLITKACVDYMDHCSYNELNPQDPLLNYCVFNWGYHAEIGDSAGIAQEFLFDVFYWPSVDRISFWPIMHELFRLQGLPGLPSKSTSFLHVASQYGLCNTIQALPVRVPLGKFLNQADDVGRTPLHYACAYERANIVSLLLRLGADVDAIDKENCTPLHMAVRSGHAGIVRCLLNRGANIGCLDAQRETPLHYAVRKGSTDTVELLLKRGADPNYLDRYGNSILALAAIKGNEAVARLALSLNNTKWPSISYGIALTFAAAFGLSELVRSLLSSKRCVDYRDLYVQQAFIAAIVGASEEIASILIDFGCNPNVHDHQHGQSALSIAAASGNERVVVFLLQNGADVNIRDIQTGRTPVIHAISYGRPIIVRLLVENGARVELPKHNHMDGNDGWIFRIASALIRLCPNSNDRTHKTKKTGGPARQNTSSFTRRQSMRKAPIGQKRSHPDESPDEDDEDSQDERMNGKHKKYKPLPCACPFQKRFPRQHKCQPKANVQRLKEHLYRVHVMVFCPHCWKTCSDEDAKNSHLRTNSCAKVKRTNFSQGISSKQAQDLKSRKVVSKMSQEEQWKHVYRILFPDDEGVIPSSSYVTPSGHTAGRVRRVCNDPHFQRLLGNTVGAEHVQEVCRLFQNHLADNNGMAPTSDEEVATPSEDIRVIHNSDNEVVPPVENNNNVAVTSTHHHEVDNTHLNEVCANKDVISSLQPYSGHNPHEFPTTYMPPVAQLNPLSVRQQPSDSGIGTHHSMGHASAPNNMYAFRNMGQGSLETPDYHVSEGAFDSNSTPANFERYPASDPDLTSPYAANMWTGNNGLPTLGHFANRADDTVDLEANEYSYGNSGDTQWLNISGTQGAFGSSNERGFE